MADLTLKEMQNQVDNWIKENGGYWHPLSVLAQIKEENSELIEAVEDYHNIAQISKAEGRLARTLNNLYGGRVKKLEDPEEKIGEEISDLLFAIMCLANPHHIDLESFWKKTIDARCERDKTRYKK